MASVVRTIQFLCVSLLAVAVLSRPAAALPRVTCVPVAECDQGTGSIATTVVSHHHACCPGEKSADDADPRPCCVLTAGVPADFWAGSVAIALPQPALDATPAAAADPRMAPPAAVKFGRVAYHGDQPPTWRIAPEQGFGPRPPPIA